jgi:high affinity choline transporter 7
LLRIGGGEPLLGIPHFIPYPEIFAAVIPGTAADWYDPATGAMLFPFKVLAAGAGLILLPATSRFTSKWSAPRPLRNPAADEDRKTGESPALDGHQVHA